MKKYKIQAQYRADVELIVTTKDNIDVDAAMDPCNWEDIEHEEQVDYTLQDTCEAEEYKDE